MTYLDPLACALFLLAAFTLAGVAQTAWFAAEHRSLDPETKRLWSHAAVRCRHAAGPRRRMGL